jgi:hypothetical protein
MEKENEEEEKRESIWKKFKGEDGKIGEGLTRSWERE